MTGPAGTAMPPLARLFVGGTVVEPDGTRRADLLLVDGRIAAVGELGAAAEAGSLVERVDVTGLTFAPGLIDAHAHILGGGGGDGFASRVPELRLTDLTGHGITTVVGVPGIDMVSRNLEGLLAKARALGDDGMTAYLYVGGFGRPLANLTGSVWRDAYLLPEVVGVKLAVGDDRAPSIDARELVDLARELAWAERARGRALVVHAHLGTRPEGIALLRDVLGRVPNPARLVVTHCNWSRTSLEAAAGFLADGATVDVSTLMDPGRGIEGAVSPSVAVAELLEGGSDPGRVSMTTDGNGHVPGRTSSGWDPYETLMDTLFAETRKLALERGLGWPAALRVVTANPAAALGLDRKGVIRAGADADLVVLDADGALVGVYARGREMVRAGAPIVRDRYEVRTDAG
ncbi:MAG TPA: amidohydrolase family protein [Candidatus Limnocylindrales bacterium]|nr:amidohydrolase family protein [Candidatus Limnocylindrales bacterium]